MDLRFDMADVKPSVLSWMIVGLMATTFILFLKYLLNRWPVRGATEMMNAV